MYTKCFKRIIDLAGSILLLPFLMVALILVAPIIYFADRGSVFYNAPRVGKDFREFKMYKFRSMKVNAPDIRNADGSTFNSEDDLRVTKVGKILRKTSLDEVPQIINIIMGDMSFVGPRPILPGYNLAEFSEPMYKRMKIRPGITGYVQAYYRNSIPRMDKYTQDAFYVDHESFSLDIRIIAKTLSTVILRKNINTNQMKIL